MSNLVDFQNKNCLVKLIDTDLFKTESQKNQILMVIKDYRTQTRKQVTDQLINTCYPVTCVTYVTQKNEERGDESELGNKGNKGNRVTSFESLLASVKVTLNRLVENELILVDKSSKEHIYSLSDLGEESLLMLLKEWIVHKKRKENKENKKSFISVAYSVIEDYYTSILGEVLNNYHKGNKFAEIDVNELSKFNPDVADYFLETPDEGIGLAKLVLAEILSRQGVNQEPNVTISNVPKSCRTSITKLRVSDLDKMISVVGEIRSRSKSHIQINAITYECPACGKTRKMIQNGDKETKPSRCTNCDYKGKMSAQDAVKDDFLKLTIYDLYENLSSSEVPEELNIYLQKDLFGFSYLKEGDKVEIVGVATSDNKTDARGNRVLFQEKVFQGYGIVKLDNSFADEMISPKDEKAIIEISKDPLKFHKTSLFSDLHGVDLPAIIASICLYGNHNILFAGAPGCGKTEITRRIADISLKGKFANCSTSSSSGILGSVTKNEFTGKYTLDGGIFRPVHPGGNVVLDEINRDNDRDLQKAILGVMNDKRININKANTRIDEACEVSVWCTANPTSNSNYKKPHERFSLLEPLYDRYDLVVYFVNQLDWDDLEIVEGLLNDADKKFKLEDEDIILLKKYQLKAQTIEVQLTKDDNKKLALLMKTVLPQFGEKLSYRKLKTVSSLLKSICRMHLRDHTMQEDYVLLTDIYSKMHRQKVEFDKSDYSEVM